MVAAARAVGSMEPDESVRNPDWMARQFIGPEELRLIEDHALSGALDQDYAELSQRLEIFELVMLMLIRTKCIDEFFQRALTEGIEQFVILGAGFDSRAYRFSDQLKNRRVIELDFPTTQEWKKRRVKSVLGSLPDHVTYAPIDFIRDSIGDVLAAAGHDRSKPTFYLSEGLCMYLAESVVRVTLQALAASSAAGSELVIEYVSAMSIKFVQQYPIGPIKSAVKWGEPWVFGVPDDGDAEFFSEVGLKLIERVSLNSIEVARRYALRASGMFYGAHLMEAFKARGQQMASQLSPEAREMASRWSYFIGDLRVQ
jgi:methyltransferase (TIGR00027 family)